MDKLEELNKEIKNFVDERDWNQFHSPANLSKSISIEANELLECFQWDETNYNLDDVKEELADVINYCIQMAQVLNLDIYQIVKDKLEKTKKKYPVDKCYCIQMAQVLNLDIYQIVKDKLEKTKKKYPVDKCKSISTKYDKL